MKVREPRRKVVINSRMRCGTDWRDARILNVSSRGLGLHAPAPPLRGSYVEVRRGPHIIIAQVVWVNGSRFGVRTQDAVPIDAIASASGSSDVSVNQRVASEGHIERRSSPRSAERQHEASKTVARAMEFVFIALFGASAALLATGMVKQVVGRPLAGVELALSR